MDRIYLDNSATSFPKAPGVGDAMKYYIDSIGCNIKRGAYRNSYSAEEVVLETRNKLCKLFNFDILENVIFTMNITQSLNFLIKGLLKPGDHCIVSSMEHNAVMRPLVQLKGMGVEFSKVSCSTSGELNPEDLYPLIKQNTKAVIMTHASNVCGTLLPIREVGQICKEKNIFFIVDTAQTAGIMNIDFKEYSIDALAFTGHKGLLGPQGIGGFLVSQSLANHMTSLISGGTGSLSGSENAPPFMPDKFEAGTPNLPGIFGLNAALKYIESQGGASIRKSDLELTELFLEGIRDMKNIEIIGLKGIGGRVGVVSLNFIGMDNSQIAFKLDREFGIMTRCGLHCAPSAHKTLGTFPQGTVRFSFGPFNTRAEISCAVDAIYKLVSKQT